MIVLGIDPAIRTTGYAVVEAAPDGDCRVLDCGVIENKARYPHSECLRRLSGGIRQILEAFPVESAALEDPFVGRNAKTAIILGMARGAILSVLAERGLEVFSYSPSTAKKAAVGVGNAEKEQVALMMASELDMLIDNIPLDSTDALAIAVCHARKIVNPQLAGLLTKPL